MTTTGQITEPDIRADISELKRQIRALVTFRTSFSMGIKLMPDGTPYFPGGIAVGGSGVDIIKMLADVPPPTNLVISEGAHEDGTIYADLTWDNPTGYGQEQVTQYEITAVKTGEPWPLTTFAKRNFDDATTGVRLEPLQPDSDYDVSVQSMAGLRHSVALTGTLNTAHDTVAPAAPTWSATPTIAGIGSVALDWNDNTEPDVINFHGGYRVRAYLSSSNALVRDFMASLSAVTITNLAMGEQHKFILNAVDSSGNQSPDSTIQLATPRAIISTDLAFSLGGGNLFRNSNFEYDSDANGSPDSWTTNAPISNTQGIILDGANKYRDNYSLKIQAATAADYYEYQDIFFAAAGRYVVSAYIDRSGVTVSTGTGSGINIVAQSGSFTVFSNSLGGSTLIFATGTIAWRREHVVIDVAANSTLRFYMQQGVAGNCTGTTRFDAVQLEEGNSPSAYAARPDELAPGSIGPTQIADNAITTPKLAAGSVIAGKIAANTITAAQIMANTITAAQIAADTITANQIAADTITANEIQANAITTDKLVANSIIASKIAVGTITADRLAASVILVGQQIRSSIFTSPDVSNGAGWRLYTDGTGAGFVEATGGVFRNIDTYGMTLRGEGVALHLSAGRLDGSVIVCDTSGWFLVPGKFYVDPQLARIECVANLNIGANYSGGVYAMDASFNEDVNWGMSIDHPTSTQYHTKLRYHLGGDGTERRAGVFEMSSGWMFFADQAPSNQSRTTWGIFSDRSLKQDIIPLEEKGEVTSSLRALNPVEFQLIDDPTGRRRMGYIADEFEQVFPDLTSKTTATIDGPEITSIHYEELIPVLARSLVELEDRIAILEQG